VRSGVVEASPPLHTAARRLSLSAARAFISTKEHAMALHPFADETASLQIGGLTVENRTDRVSVYGSLDITRDRIGLARAAQLQLLLNAVVAALRSEGDALPQAVPIANAPTTVRNPFKP
jgi:hypothetical protein